MVRIDEVVVVLPDGRVNCCRRAVGQVVIAGGDNEVRVPAFHEIGDLVFVNIVGTIGADHRKANGSALRGGR